MGRPPYGGISSKHKNRLLKELADRQRRERQNLKQELMKDAAHVKRSLGLHKESKAADRLADEEQAKERRIGAQRIREAAPFTSPVGGPVVQRTVKGQTTPRWKKTADRLFGDPSPVSQAWPHDPDPEATSIRQVSWEDKQSFKEPAEEVINQGIFPVKRPSSIDGIARAGGTRGSRRY